jgi:hypothetical protein
MSWGRHATVVRTRLRACWSHGDGTDDGLSAPLSKLSIKGDHLWPLTAQVREFAPHETRLSLLTYLHLLHGSTWRPWRSLIPAFLPGE